ncbi:2-oxoacid:ferredoxin oxidoreductase subunit beta [Marinigracilibium pacificum]|uniref:2-oxoacid:ferredoxin oxidoreductase subunit beta n=1 Tax=Marinigracilibium pacificum TaxID=2729599 RepID=A0A848J2M9_9BACT|nr:2-oxoacid:ferredoxin oxidoreductase subunit beta [Marinigracilibium pacificum]NMM48579.1 2-oxoacid:ferredoxin oxidoreductase subunit beta [Marinigracilibium pacificum]
MLTKNNSNGNSLTAKDFATDQDVRWCPGCGDYSILKQIQTILPSTNVPREDIVFISGIGCSSRFPYYMNTYGMHSIHGRAGAIVSGLKAVNPSLDIWMITGDGDSLSIGGNHFIHLLRRNFNVNIVLFNNQIYGLTKGQYSPTSPKGQVTKSTPFGSVDMPFNPITLALGSEGTFVARTIDRNPVHMREILTEAHDHKGASFIEIYQNCNVFNDGAFETFTDKSMKDENTLYLEHGKPLLFDNDSKGVILDGFKPVIVDMDKYSAEDCWVHDMNDKIKASILAEFFDYSEERGKLPRPFGVFYKSQRNTYEQVFQDQIDLFKAERKADLDTLLSGKNFWEIK